jgi:hypothetical protein
MSLARQQRRAAERHERKNLRKQMQAEPPTTAEATPVPEVKRNCLPPEVAARHAQEQREWALRDSNPQAYYDLVIERARAAERAEEAEQAEQAERNRKNAQHSSGPRTEAGKATSSKNSFKHGLYSKDQHMTEEEMKSFHDLKMNFVKEYNPSGPTEILLIHQMTEHFIRLQRFQKMEANMMQNEETPISHLAAVHRFLNSAERGFHKNLKALREIQKEKAKAASSATKNPAPRQDCGVKGGAVSGTGFVPQKSKTASAVNNAAVSQGPAASGDDSLKQAA